MTWPVYWCEPTGRERLFLRRYADGPCEGSGFSFHNAQVLIGEQSDAGDPIGDLHPHDDPRWPEACEHCGRPFEDSDSWQLFRRDIYVRPDTGQEFTLDEADVGACYNATWISESREAGGFMTGADGRSLFVKCPDGHLWCIDARASNCTLPDDKAHKCWVRHGRPEDGDLHVDKNGVTCAAGAGSIDTGKWHGFLHHGGLVEC